MATYIAMGKFTTEGKKTIKDASERNKKAHEALSSAGAKVIGEYAICGPYDSIRIIEGSDDIKKIIQAQAKIAAMGTVDWQTFPAITSEELLKLL